MSLHHQHVAILGGGRSGLAAAALALREGAFTVIYDTADGDKAAKLRASVEAACPGAVVVCAPESLREPVEKFDLLVTSPGIDLVEGWGKMMASRVTEVIGEIEFASRYFHGRTIGITGTNGKTTTTEMARDLLLEGGQRALAAGNYGLSFSEVVLHHPGIRALALELSSFQLETMDRYRPDVAVWLNFAPDHMDRYRSVEEYRRAKENIYRNIGPEQTAVVPPAEAARAASSGAKVVTFAVDAPADWTIRDGQVTRHGEPVLSLGEVAVRGRHNHANLLAAWAAAHAFGIEDRAARAVFARYLPPPHRYELVATLEGVDYINDSKSTNLHSLETALAAEDRPFILIAGGKNKELDFGEVAGLVARHCRAVVAIGEIRPHLRATLAPGVDFHEAESLAEAVENSRRLACPGDAVLLSPGTSSFDMFRDYQHRGEEFRAIVHAMLPH
jgi:UDP-N-acetylmuramoylalanine--D-glutamate ligase